MAHENNKICRVSRRCLNRKRYRIVTMLANGKMSRVKFSSTSTSRSRRCLRMMRLLIDAELVNNQRISRVRHIYELNPEMLQNMIDVFDDYQHPRNG